MDQKAILDAGRVRRYHTENMLRYQTVAEHSWGVAVLALRFWPSRPHLVQYALLHDIGEKASGDVPATAKWKNKPLKALLDVIEEHYATNIGADLPELSENDSARLKICDYLELMDHCLCEMKMGNRFAGGPFSKVQQSISQRMSDINEGNDFALINYIEEMNREAYSINSGYRR